MSFLYGSPAKQNQPNMAASETPASPSIASGSEKPLPAIRPGTSGTENLLVTSRRQASARYQKAQRAERSYIAKKRSDGAKADYIDAKHHFRQSGHHLKEGVKMTFSMFKSVPYMLGQRREAGRAKKEEKAKARQEEKRRKLEEKLAKQKEAEEGKEGEGEGESEGKGEGAK